MVTVAYMSFVMICSLLGAVLGFAGHFARAHFTYTAEDLGLGEPWDSLTRDDYMFEKHVVGAECDDNGFWDADSNRNLIYYVVSGLVVPLILGFALWPERETIVTITCNSLLSVGLTPMVCG